MSSKLLFHDLFCACVKLLPRQEQTILKHLLANKALYNKVISSYKAHLWFSKVGGMYKRYESFSTQFLLPTMF